MLNVILHVNQCKLSTKQSKNYIIYINPKSLVNQVEACVPGAATVPTSRTSSSSLLIIKILLLSYAGVGCGIGTAPPIETKHKTQNNSGAPSTRERKRKNKTNKTTYIPCV